MCNQQRVWIWFNLLTRQISNVNNEQLLIYELETDTMRTENDAALEYEE